MFTITFGAVAGTACGLLVAGVIGLALYAGWFLLDRYLVGLTTPEEKPK